MLAALDSLIASLGVILAALIGLAFAVRQYRAHLREDGVAVAVSYRNAIASLRHSLSEAIKVREAFDGPVPDLPPDAIFDYRREDWADMHGQLCGKLGTFVYIDRTLGLRANAAVTRVFTDFKYVREVFGFALVLTKGKALYAADGETARAEATADLLDTVGKALAADLEKLVATAEAAERALDALLDKAGIRNDDARALP